MHTHSIPTHNFTRDDDASIPFRLLPLEHKSAYDFSVPHRHNYYEIFLFREGGGVHDIDFQSHEIHSNGIHFVSPGQVHHVRRALLSSGYVILFSRDFFYLNLQSRDLLMEMPFLHQNSPWPLLNLAQADYARLEMYVQQMQAAVEAKHPLLEDMLRPWLSLLLTDARHLFGQIHPENSLQPAQPLYREFRALLETHFRTHHLVRDYAGMLAVTEKNLNESIKKATGKTVLSLIHERIVLEAKRLLLHSGLSNKEVAFFLSFEDPSHFSKFFRNLTGLSPTEYRAAHNLNP